MNGLAISYALQTAPVASGRWAPLLEVPFLHPPSRSVPLETLLNGFYEGHCRVTGETALPVVSELHRGMHLLAKSLVALRGLPDRLEKIRRASDDERRINLLSLAPTWKLAERMALRHPQPREGVIASFLTQPWELGSLLVSGEFIPLLPVGHTAPLGCQILLSAFYSYSIHSSFFVTSETYVMTHELELERKIGPERGVERRLRIRREPSAVPFERAGYYFEPTLPQSEGMVEIVASGREPREMTITRWVDKRPDKNAPDDVTAIAEDYRLLRDALAPWA